ncbi:MAG: HEPN domain-containing protein [Ignavibacteriaceae bacterium]
MNKEEHIKYWIETSKYDLGSAFAIFNSGKFNWSLFIAHLALEKLLKALWVKNNKENNPPKIHDLAKIGEGAKIDLTVQQFAFLRLVNTFNFEARYPDYKFSFYKICTKEFAEINLYKIKEMYQWLETKI